MRSDYGMVQRLKSEGREPVSCQQGREMMQLIKACHYVECSALIGVLKHVFDEALRIAINPHINQPPHTVCGCLLL
uniref:Uncharacterized protein n=1 Tax=Arcella intermedia TaxID=1963864 RepID=A0A6B2LVI7_9EUKA